MTELHAALLVTGALVLVLGLVSSVIAERLPVTSPLLSLLTGVLLGPAGFEVFDLDRWGDRDVVLGEASRLTLAIGLMAIALRLPPRYFMQHWRLQAILLGVLMPAMWIAATLVLDLWLGVPVLLALLIGAIVTPTDPIVATSIVTGASAKRRLPARIREAISAESGANDGLAHAFVILAVLLLTPAASIAGEWFTTVLLVEIAGGIVVGVLLGAAAGRLLTISEARGGMDESSFLAFTVALALVILGASQLLGVNAVLAVFVAGLAFDNMVGGSERAEEANVQEAVNQFFTLPIFALIGLVVPVQQWVALGWRGLGAALAILILRRLPAVLALRPWLGPLHRRDDAVFVGWFGPIGVSAVLYSSEALQRTGDDLIWTVTSLIICTSIVAHGVTATPFSQLYARRAASRLDIGPLPESGGRSRNGIAS